MQHWTRRRWASFIIHAVVVSIPLTFATISALFFWQSLFQSWLIASAMVACVDALAVLGLVLCIARIASPFQALRHFLPFVSVVPLGLELYTLLAAHNVWYLAAAVSVLTTVIMTLIAWRCYVTIERLFIDPVTAAREKMAANVQQLTETLASIAEMNAVAAGAIRDWSQQQQIIVSAPHALPDTTASRSAVRRYADRTGVSERTIWRHLEQGKLSAADLGADTDVQEAA